MCAREMLKRIFVAAALTLWLCCVTATGPSIAEKRRKKLQPPRPADQEARLRAHSDTPEASLARINLGGLAKRAQRRARAPTDEDSISEECSSYAAKGVRLVDHRVFPPDALQRTLTELDGRAAYEIGEVHERYASLRTLVELAIDGHADNLLGGANEFNASTTRLAELARRKIARLVEARRQDQLELQHLRDSLAAASSMTEALLVHLRGTPGGSENLAASLAASAALASREDGSTSPASSQGDSPGTNLSTFSRSKRSVSEMRELVSRLALTVASHAAEASASDPQGRSPHRVNSLTSLSRSIDELSSHVAVVPFCYTSGVTALLETPVARASALVQAATRRPYNEAISPSSVQPLDEAVLCALAQLPATFVSLIESQVIGRHPVTGHWQFDGPPGSAAPAPLCQFHASGSNLTVSMLCRNYLLEFLLSPSLPLECSPVDVLLLVRLIANAPVHALLASLRDAFSACIDGAPLRRLIVSLVVSWIGTTPHVFADTRQPFFALLDLASAVESAGDIVLTTELLGAMHNRLLTADLLGGGAQSAGPVRWLAERANVELFLEYDPAALACALGALEHELVAPLCELDLLEHAALLATDAVGDERAATRRMAQYAEQQAQLASWVATLVLSASRLSVRVAVLARFCNLAMALHERRNFASLGAVVAGLESTVVRRLERSWVKLDRKVRKQIARILEFVSSPDILLGPGAMPTAGTATLGRGPRTIPHLLREVEALSFTLMRRPLVHADSGLVECDALRSARASAQRLLSFRGMPPAEVPERGTLLYLRTLCALPKRELFVLSLKVEP